MDKITQLISSLRKKNIRLRLLDEKLEILSTKAKISVEDVELIRNHSDDLIQYISKLDRTSQRFDRISKAPKADSYPVSHSQRRLWILCQFEEDQSNYNVPSFAKLTGVFNCDSLEKAILSTIDRHEILRTIFKEDHQGELRQWIRSVPEYGFKLNYVDLITQQDADQFVADYLEKDAYKQFDLENGPLLRVVLFRISEQDYALYYNIHHIICDGMSLEILSDEVMHFYAHFEYGTPITLEPLTIHYKDYVWWLQNRLDIGSFDSAEMYWKKQFENGICPLKLPFEKKRPEIYSHDGEALEFYFSLETKQELERLTAEENGTLYITLLLTVSTLLYKYTGEEQIQIGSSFSLRTHKDVEGQIGFYVNNLPIITRFSESMTIHELYGEIKKNVTRVIASSDYPLERLIDLIGYKYDKSVVGLINVLMDLNNDVDFEITDPDLVLFKENVPSKFDLSFEFHELGNGLRCILNYNKNLFDRRHIELLVERLKELTRQIITRQKSDQVLGEVSLEQPRIKKQLTENF